jgi:hypothetical protein
MELSYAGLCSYCDGNGRLCRCHLQVYRDGDIAVVVATELEDNPGSSITNSFEYLATGVWQKLGLTFEQTTWIEHYCSESYGFPIEELINWVKLEWRDSRLVSPEWRSASRQELEQLIGQPFTQTEYSDGRFHTEL